MRILGSPPHTRGADFHPDENPEDYRITPAYAGSRTPTWTSSKGLRDHPRIRGEQPSIKGTRTLATGSPPHTRGAVHLPPGRHDSNRITLAYAGSR